MQKKEAIIWINYSVFLSLISNDSRFYGIRKYKFYNNTLLLNLFWFTVIKIKFEWNQISIEKLLSWWIIYIALSNIKIENRNYYRMGTLNWNKLLSSDIFRKIISIKYKYIENLQMVVHKTFRYKNIKNI